MYASPTPPSPLFHHSTLHSICHACNTVASWIRERAGQPIYEFHFWLCVAAFCLRARVCVCVYVSYFVGVCVCVSVLVLHPSMSCPGHLLFNYANFRRFFNMQRERERGHCFVFIFCILYRIYSACDDIMDARTHTHTSALGICMRLDLIFHRIAFWTDSAPSLFPSLPHHTKYICV